jgi:hypothetical protein
MRCAMNLTMNELKMYAMKFIMDGLKWVGLIILAFLMILLFGPVLTYVLVSWGGPIKVPLVGDSGASATWVGFYGNFSGGIIGAIVAYGIMRYQKKQENKQGERALFLMLKYTYDQMIRYSTFNKNQVLIYDNDWPKYLAQISITADDLETLVKWFNEMKEIENDCHSMKPGTSIDTTDRGKDLDKIEIILSKHKGKINR